MRRLIAGHRLLGPGPCDPWQELAVAVLLRAVRDSLTDPEAVTWLRGPGDDLAHALGWPAGALRDVRSGARRLAGVVALGLRLEVSATYNTVAVSWCK